MAEMVKILEGVKVEKLVNQINASAQLWNQYTLRTKFLPDSPHREVDDIWVRYRDIKQFNPEKPEEFAMEHDSVWYPAYRTLTHIQALINNLSIAAGVTKLGGVLITRIPAGKKVYPHSDAGHWHSEHYRNKYMLLLQSAPGQKFCFDGEEHEGVAGDLFLFDNRTTHWVENNSDTDRISLILATRNHLTDIEDQQRELPSDSKIILK